MTYNISIPKLTEYSPQFLSECKELCHNATFNARMDFLLLITAGWLTISAGYIINKHYLSNYVLHPKRKLCDNIIFFGMILIFFGILLGIYRLTNGVLFL